MLRQQILNKFKNINKRNLFINHRKFNLNKNINNKFFTVFGGIGSITTLVLLNTYGQNKSPIQLEAKPKNIDKIGNVSKDNDTGVEFPNVINVFDDNSKILSLIGLGVRTVSFLKIRVYSLGIYADDNAINDLKGIDNIKEKLTNVKNEELTTESIMNNVINSNTVFAVRIVPVRNTDFGHLRDGFIRAIQARMKLLKISDEIANDINLSLQSFKAFFPPSKVPKGDELTLIKTHNKDLILSYNGKMLGKLDSKSPGVEFISTQLLLAYFADKNPISAKAKQNMIDNL